MWINVTKDRLWQCCANNCRISQYKAKVQNVASVQKVGNDKSNTCVPFVIQAAQKAVNHMLKDMQDLWDTRQIKIKTTKKQRYEERVD